LRRWGILLGMAAMAVTACGWSAQPNRGGSPRTETAVQVPEPALEPVGTVPRQGDRRIPNPVTPDGVPVGSYPRCTVVFHPGPAGSATTVNRFLARIENRLHRPEVVCLTGLFRQPIQIWGKFDPTLITVEASSPGAAVIAPGPVRPSAVNPHEYDGVAGAVSLVDSTGVMVRGLVVTGYDAQGPQATPAGIYVEVVGPGFRHHPSACFTRASHACGNIFLIGNTITAIANTADEDPSVRRWCDNPNVDAFGILVEAYGRGGSGMLQHVVIAHNTVENTRTGQSETVAVNGDVQDFLVSDNTIANTDNIGLDVEGWYAGTSPARYGLILDNLVANVDTWSNTAYGRWSRRQRRCLPLEPNAAGIYDDGAEYLWIQGNTVANTNQGIDVDVENADRFTADIVVRHNVVWDSAGTRLGDPSWGPNPPGLPGRSAVAGHAYDAFYVDAYGLHSDVYDVYAYDNRFQNASRFFGGRRIHHNVVVGVGGHWRSIVLWDNLVIGGGPTDPWTSLLGIDAPPLTPRGTWIDCTEYRAPTRLQANFFLGPHAFGTLAAWQRGNRYDWDRRSAMNRLPGCAPMP
jgi:hypothetical protein